MLKITFFLSFILAANAAPVVQSQPASQNAVDTTSKTQSPEKIQRRSEQTKRMFREIGIFNSSSLTTQEDDQDVLDVRHDVSGQFEDVGGKHGIQEDKLRPRGREWRKALAEKINQERMDKWRQGEAKARSQLHTIREAEKFANSTGFQEALSSNDSR